MVAFTGEETRAIMEQSEGYHVREQSYALKALNVDSAGRLRVAAETATCTISSGTITTVTNLTNWGLLTATVRTQVDSMLDFNAGYRRNLVVS